VFRRSDLQVGRIETQERGLQALKLQGQKSLCENLGIFVGRGFSHDKSLQIQSGFSGRGKNAFCFVILSEAKNLSSI
jgi:hypothetical protein